MTKPRVAGSDIAGLVPPPPARPTAGVPAPTRPSLAKNTVAQSTPLVIGYVCSFLSAPVILAGLGLRAFGIWSLTGALAQYATLLDLGVGQTLSRFVAAEDNDDRVGRYTIGQFLSVGLATVAVVLAALVTLSFTLGSPLSTQFHGISPASMTLILLSSAAIVCSSMLCRVLTAYSIGRRNMVPPNIALSISAVVFFIFSVGIILLGGHLVAYALANAAAAAVAIVITLVVVLAQSTKPPLSWPTKARILELLRFSVKNQILAVSSLVNYQSDKIVLALFIGPAAAGAYELSNRVALAARAVGVYTVSAMVPTLTASRARGTRDQLVSAYRRLTEASAALSVPCLVLCAAIAPLLLRAWLGHVPQHSAIILVALCVAYLANTTTGVGYATAYAEGLPGIPARAAIATAAGNVALTVALTPLFGIWGTLAGTVVALTVGALYQVALLHKSLSMAMSLYWHATLPTLALSVALVIPVASLSAVLSSDAPRTLEAGLSVASAGCYAAVYLVCAGRLRLLPSALSRRLPRLAASAARDGTAA
jgi:O-antigen/teichoic acid export membrane protein